MSAEEKKFVIVVEREGVARCYVKNLGRDGSRVMTWERSQARSFMFELAVKKARALTAASRATNFDVIEVDA